MSAAFPGLGGPAPRGNPGPLGSGGGFPGLTPPPSTGAFDPAPSDGTGSRSGDAGPPLLLLGSAVVAPLVTLPLLVLDGWGWHVVGWAVATLLTAALLIMGTLEDTRRRASSSYLYRDGLVRALRGGALLLALLAAAGHAWQFADWFARLPAFAA